MAESIVFANPDLMFALAQISAVFVAIIAGFYTTKVLSISNERKRLRNRIEEIDLEINGKKPIINNYNTIIDNILIPRAEKTVSSFTKELLKEPNIHECSLKELKDEFTKIEKYQPNEYESEILESELENINKQVKEELEERKKPKSVLTGLNLGAFSELADFDLRRPEFIVSENQRVHDAQEKLLTEESIVNSLENLKKRYKSELTGEGFPHYLYFGLLSMFIFIITGVLFPLIHHIWSPYMGAFSDNIALILFTIGIAGIIVYIAFEVRFAEKS